MNVRVISMSLLAVALMGVTGAGTAIPGRYCLPVKTALRSTALAFTVPALDGSTISFDNSAHQPAVIGFFATWCKPCNEEMPAFAEVVHRYTAQGFKAVLIDVGEQPAAVKAFVAKFNLDFQVGIDPDSTVFQKAMGLHAIPSSAFYNSSGVLTCLVQGSLEKSEIDNEASAAVNGWMPKP